MNSLWHAITVWDRSAFLAVNNGMSSPALDRVMPPISDLGLGHVQVLALLALAIVSGAVRGEIRRARDVWLAIAARRRWLVPMLLAFSISGLGAMAFKHSIPRDRPAWFYEKEHEAGRFLDVHVHMVGRRPIRVRGFLSGHTATSIALAMTATLLYWRRRSAHGWLAGAWALALVIGISRIYIADHWPVDVVSGFLLGLASGWAAIQISQSWRWLDTSATAGDADCESPIADYQNQPAGTARTGLAFG